MRYIIGIDLGTTNSCVSYVDTQDLKLSIQPFYLPQIITPGYVEKRSTLPSFCYISIPHEWPTNSLALPWKKGTEHTVGVFAQTQGTKTPTRLIQSAKSWLCHPAANRKDKILPTEADEDLKISPIEATAKYLGHIKDAWDYLMARSDAGSEFEQQEIVLTVPASFDEVARRLTVEAAKIANYNNVTLLEEPQAAFYSWISSHENRWQREGDLILVCDVGGGTTDFSLIEMQKKDETLCFNRIAVGNHLLLGGDNMDAAIAHHVEKKLDQINEGKDFSPVQWMQLQHQARVAKETLLNESKNAETFPILLQGTGSSVVKGSISSEVHREELTHLLLNGFFGQYTWNEALELRKTAGLRTMGLPYEEEPSITKHLAAFLKRSQVSKAPDYVLFNGGAMKPAVFQQAVIHSLAKWYPGSQTKTLESSSLDLAVAQGAAYYGKVRRGLGIRISGGIPKAFYLAVEIKKSETETIHQALTLLPRGSEEGASYTSTHPFSLRSNQPVSFHLYTSQVRLKDQQGELIDMDLKELQPLPPIHTILRFGKKQTQDSFTEKIPVNLHLQLTAVGTLELWLQSQKTDHRWSLEFQIKRSSGQDDTLSLLEIARKEEMFDTSYLKSAQDYIQDAFSSAANSEKIMESIEKLIEKPRKEWSTNVLRGLFDSLIKVAPNRKLNRDLEIRWWNMAGFFLRPGFGYPLDDFRIKELWKIILNEFKIDSSPECQIQQWICYRRVAGGFNKGQQTQIANEFLNAFFPNKANKFHLKSKSELYSYTEKVRTFASFELIDVSQKVKVGNALLKRILDGEASSSDFWALGRIGARHLIYGSSANVIDAQECSKWIQTLLNLPPSNFLANLFCQLARKTDHRQINISQSIVDEIISNFSTTEHSERLNQLLTHSTALSHAEQEHIFGDKLPAGLVLEM